MLRNSNTDPTLISPLNNKKDSSLSFPPSMQMPLQQREPLPLETDSPTTTTTTPTTPTTTTAHNNSKRQLAAYVTGWYLTSVVCTNTSKSIPLPWYLLTLSQLVIGSCCTWFGIRVVGLGNRSSSNGNSKNGNSNSRRSIWPPTPAALLWTTGLAGTLVGGLVTLNLSLQSNMSVATVMTLRAAEPVATLLLGLWLLPQETTCNTTICFSLGLILLGAALATSTLAPEEGTTTSTATTTMDHPMDHPMNNTTTITPERIRTIQQDTNNDEHNDEPQNPMMGLVWIAICNVMFALRTIVTKLLKAQPFATASNNNNNNGAGLDNYTLFFQLCVIGSALQAMVVLGVVIADVLASPGRTNMLKRIMGHDNHVMNFQLLTSMLVNGMSFYAYLQLSWIVMGLVGAVTHSVCNALRRPVICLAGWVVFGGATVPGVTGAMVATVGSMVYAHAKMKQNKSNNNQ